MSSTPGEEVEAIQIGPQAAETQLHSPSLHHHADWVPFLTPAEHYSDEGLHGPAEFLPGGNDYERWPGWVYVASRYGVGADVRSLATASPALRPPLLRSLRRRAASPLLALFPHE